MIIDPRGFGDDFQAWADQMSWLVQEEAETIVIFTPLVGATWQDWAGQVFGEPDVLGQDAPDPQNFDTWQEWAMRLFDTHDFSG